MNDVKILRDAAEALEKGRLAKGTYFNPYSGGMCARGAVMMARAGFCRPDDVVASMRFHDAYLEECQLVDDHEERLMRAVAEFIGLEHGEWRCFGGDIASWNDEEGRTKEDVVAALRGTADMLEMRSALEQNAPVEELVGL